MISHLTRAQLETLVALQVGELLPGGSIQSVWAESVTQNYKLGSRLVVYNGGVHRSYYYGHIHAGITGGMARGRVMMSSDDGTERGAFLGAMTAGQYTVNWTAVGNLTLNQFANGWLLLQGGRALEVKSNTVALAGAVSALVLYDPIPETIVAGRYGLLQENPYANVFNRGSGGVHANHAGCVVGVLNGDYTAGYYVWLQTAGPCGVLSDVATYGDEDHTAGEHEFVLGIEPGDPVKVADGYGYQTIGRNLIANAVNWENENFIIVDLTIKA